MTAPRPFTPYVPPVDPRCGTCGQPIQRPTRHGWQHVRDGRAAEPQQHLAWPARDDKP
jgi:hypothetical protein